MEQKIQKRNAKDFGFDHMIYENGLEEHSTKFEVGFSEEELKTLKLGDLIGMMRVASNAKKSLKLTKKDGEKQDSIKLEFIKNI